MARIQDMHDVRRMAREEHALRERPRPHIAKASEFAAPTGAGADAVVADGGADGFDLEPQALDQAEQDLARLSDEIGDHLRAAEVLGVVLQDGKSPVTRPMRRAFGLRGGDEPGGVRTALQGYMDELTAIRNAIRQVRTIHTENDHNAANGLSEQ
ncbi:hypothetical protein [Actinocrispum wychmicini]|uniref:Uncharacterized protein n=1 Tax=Actinocrispum wychmicini TaxID=1213861 RepID=A0A4R2J3E2_9PSEU|nr:hypothetical protein [Actinocrispum wychmicini]TCO52963.1 hypothetical protein EV192_111157 [Actinocrispum wychmicini]